MNSFTFLEMLEDIPEKYIVEAHEHKKSANRYFLIAAVLGLLAILTACTAFVAKDFFQAYFHLSDTPKSSSQIQFLNEQVKDIHQSQTLDGYTIEVVSTLSDEQMGYVILRFIGPEGVDFKKLGLAPGLTMNVFPENIPFPDPSKPWPKSQPSMEFYFIEDGDHLPNTSSMLIKIIPTKIRGEKMLPLKSVRWTIWFDDLIGTVRDTAYEEELRQKKYSGMENPDFTEEERRRIEQHPIIAKGLWSLTVDFSESETDSLEFLSKPMNTACTVVRWGENETYNDAVSSKESVKMNSFVLHPLGAAIRVDPNTIGEGNLGFIGIDKVGNQEKGIYAVMKDGSKIKLNAMGSASYYQGILTLEAESPILLDQVRYVLLADGTQLERASAK